METITCFDQLFLKSDLSQFLFFNQFCTIGFIL
ncbi:hypothetical protein GA0116948_11877 [Chitinophaga costaii]|uniref:Uncharacterized protein n=1 Tax=Chitinophaga costaii TaxID=1335309 RepID=A0A1C4G0G8_9BACT|nr:hypothetical protein GA0116948_11877 [Chitinophaga costaii]